MRQGLIALLVAAFVVTATPVVAAPLGAPGYNLPQLSFSVSALAGFSWREIHVRRDDERGDDGTMSRLGVRATFGPLRFLDVYGVIGAADFRMEDPDFESVLGLQYGGGLRLRLYPWFWEETGLFNVELDAQALAMRARSGSHADDFGERRVDADVWEYQGALLVSKRFQFINPYGGVAYDRMGVAFSPGGSNNVESDFHWGVFVGLDYFVTPLVFFSAELHIFTETALFLGVGVTY